MRALSFALLGLVVVALALAGCGGGDDTSNETTSSEVDVALTKAELIAKGDAICARVNREVGTIAASDIDALKMTADVAEQYVARGKALEALGSPSETKGYAGVAEASENVSKVVAQIEQAAKAKDVKALRKVSAAGPAVLGKFQTEAATYGFVKCGEAATVRVAKDSDSGTPASP